MNSCVFKTDFVCGLIYCDRLIYCYAWIRPGLKIMFATLRLNSPKITSNEIRSSGDVQRAKIGRQHFDSHLISKKTT